MGNGGSRLSALGARPHGSRPSALGSRLVKDLVAEIAAIVGHNREIDDPLVEARDLIAALVDAPRHWAVLHGDEPATPDLGARALASARKRAAGAPLAYAVGRASFRAFTLDVDERVLIPRSETELLVDLVLERCGPGGVVVDVGTGSGAIAIALAKEGRFDRVVATDISVDALTVARANAERLDAHVEFRLGGLLRTFNVQRRSVEPREQLACVVSNPPYIAFSEHATLPRSVRDWEPAVALYSARDGLALTAQLVRQAATRLMSGGLLALEVDARRASLVAELVAAHPAYCNVEVKLDLFGRERFVLATRRGEA